MYVCVYYKIDVICRKCTLYVNLLNPVYKRQYTTVGTGAEHRQTLQHREAFLALEHLQTSLALDCCSMIFML